MSTETARIRDLERTVEEQGYEIEMLREALGLHIAPATFVGLTALETRVLAVLAKAGTASKEKLFTAIYADRHDADLPGPKIVDVVIYKLRKKLVQHGIEITTIWGQGYALNGDMLGRAEALLAGACS